jgi:hypothetical protein
LKSEAILGVDFTHHPAIIIQSLKATIGLGKLITLGQFGAYYGAGLTLFLKISLF